MPPKGIYTKINITEFVNVTLAFPHIILPFGFLYKNPFNLSENKKGCLKLKKKKSLTQLAVKIHVRKITRLQKMQGLLNGTKLLIWKIISYACAAIMTNYISNIHIYTHTQYTDDINGIIVIIQLNLYIILQLYIEFDSFY